MFTGWSDNIHAEQLQYTHCQLRAKPWYPEMNPTLSCPKILALSGGGRHTHTSKPLSFLVHSPSLFPSPSLCFIFLILSLLLSFLWPHFLPPSFLLYVSVLHLPTDLVFLFFGFLLSAGRYPTFRPVNFLPPAVVFQGPFWRLQSLWSSGKFNSIRTHRCDRRWLGDNRKPARASVKAWVWGG